MPQTTDILKLRILLCFLQAGDNGCTVTGLSKTLCEEKYTISRILTTLEKELLIDKSDTRHPKLTEKGVMEAERYSERISTTISHSIYIKFLEFRVSTLFIQHQLKTRNSAF